MTAAMVKLSKAEGHGRPAILSTFEKFLGTSEGKKVPDLLTIGKNAEIVAHVEALLASSADDLLG